MQINKQLIAIIILASLLFSAIGAALFFFKKNQQTQKAKSELVTIFIAKEDIPRDTLLTIENLAQTTIAKEYILNTPLTKEEIIGKYTNEKIYKHEIFLKEKLDTQIAKEEKKILDFKKSSYNIKFEIFKNPNYALVQGEYINIISVYPKDGYDEKGRFNNFEVEYVANNLKVLGFIRNGRHESASITKQLVQKVVDKKTVEVIEEVKSDEVILDIDLDVLLKLTQNYNKGNQLWMVKIAYDETKENNQNQNNQEEMKNEIKAAASNTQSSTAIVNPIVEQSIKYKYRLYSSNITVLTQSAAIDYANDVNKEKSKIKNVEIAVDSNKICSQIKDKFIVGTTNSFFIRSSPSKDSLDKSLLYRNIIIPYIEKQEDWYKTCDGRYVHQSVVNEVDVSFIQSKLGKYE
ncbi:MAG: hypothetical protein PHG81_02140 [Aliarcobacter sp.]|nr:hypothetical protein [Aliarcobacter sp.]